MDKEQTAIERLKLAAQMSERYYHAPLIVTTSGGKDSGVCVALAQRAGIDFEVMHDLTTADAPETVRFVRAEFRRLEESGIKCTVNYPYYKGKRTSMWALIPQKLMPPTRIARYCCDILKETGGGQGGTSQREFVGRNPRSEKQTGAFMNPLRKRATKLS